MVRRLHIEESMFGRLILPTTMTGVFRATFRLWEGFSNGRPNEPIGSVNVFVDFQEKRRKSKFSSNSNK